MAHTAVLVLVFSWLVSNRHHKLLPIDETDANIAFCRYINSRTICDLWRCQEGSRCNWWCRNREIECKVLGGFFLAALIEVARFIFLASDG